MRTLFVILMMLGIGFHTAFAQISPPVFEVDTATIRKQLPFGQTSERVLGMDNTNGGSKLNYMFTYKPLRDKNGKQAPVDRAISLAGEHVFMPSSRGFAFDYLTDKGAEITVVNTIEITDQSLAEATVLVLTDEDVRGVSGDEIEVIRNYVTNGGSIFIEGDNYFQSISRMNKILLGTGLVYVPYDTARNRSFDSLADHPINGGIKDLPRTFNGYFELSGSANSLAINESKDTYVAVSSLGAGKVLVASYRPSILTVEPFSRTFTENIFQFLARNWAVSSRQSGGLQPGIKGFLTLTFDGSGYAGEGIYTSQINIETNDPVNPVSSIPVDLNLCSICSDIVASPSQVSPGDTVLLTSFLQSIQSATSVNYRGDSVGFGLNSPDTIFSVVPESYGESAFSVRIDSVNYLSNRINVVFPRFQLSDNMGLPGDTVILTSDKIDVEKITSLSLGDSSTSFSLLNSSSIQAVVPVLPAGKYQFVADVGGEIFKSEFFEMKLVTPSVEPALAPAGDTVRITTSDIDLSGTDRIRIFGLDARFTQVDDSTLLAVVPPSAPLHKASFEIRVSGLNYITEEIQVLSPEPTLSSDIVNAYQDCDASAGSFMIRLGWTVPSEGASNLIVVRNVKNSMEFIPENSVIYPSGLSVDANTQNFIYNIVPGQYSETVASGFPAGETYQITLYTYRGRQVGRANYSSDTSVVFFNMINPPKPTVAPSFGRVFGNDLTDTEAKIGWVKGNGEKHIILVSEFDDQTVVPRDCNRYDADPVFGDGDRIGSSHFVVYNGLGNNVTITGLKPSTRYYARVYTYNKSSFGPRYFTELISSALLITIDTRKPASISVFPNPFSSSADIALSQKSGSPVDVHLYNLAGNLVQEKRSADPKELVIGDHLKKGMYILKVYQEGKVYEKVVVKE